MSATTRGEYEQQGLIGRDLLLTAEDHLAEDALQCRHKNADEQDVETRGSDPDLESHEGRWRAYISVADHCTSDDNGNQAQSNVQGDLLSGDEILEDGCPCGHGAADHLWSG